MNLTTLLEWCRRHHLVATCIVVVAVYFIGFRVVYCVIEGCTHPADWLFHLPAEAQAAWVGSLGTLVAVWWGFVLFWQDRREKHEAQRVAAKPAAYSLIKELEAIDDRFKKLGLLHPQAARILATSAKAGRLRQELVNVDAASYAILRDDEVAGLTQLNGDIEAFNDAVGRYGSDLNYGGSTAEDLLRFAQSVHRHTGGLLSTLRSRYSSTSLRALEASDAKS